MDERLTGLCPSPTSVPSSASGSRAGSRRDPRSDWPTATTRHQLSARLVVRRVRQLDPRVNPGQEGELLAGWRYHAFVTDTTFTTVEADLTHRAHAVIEQVFADLISGPLARLPSGRFGANGAWLLCAVIAHNLLRGATLRRQIVNVAARLAHRDHGIDLHLPEHWPWAGH